MKKLIIDNSTFLLGKLKQKLFSEKEEPEVMELKIIVHTLKGNVLYCEESEFLHVLAIIEDFIFSEKVDGNRKIEYLKNSWQVLENSFKSFSEELESAA